MKAGATAVFLGRDHGGDALMMARHLAQIAQGFRWNEAAAQQSGARQCGEPFGIADIGLAPAHLLDVLGVDDQRPNPEPFQVELGALPEDAGALHHHRVWGESRDPCSHRLAITAEAAEAAAMHLPVAVLILDDGTDFDQVEVDIHSHRALPYRNQVHGDLHSSVIPAQDNGGLPWFRWITWPPAVAPGGTPRDGRRGCRTHSKVAVGGFGRNHGLMLGHAVALTFLQRPQGSTSAAPMGLSWAGVSRAFFMTVAT